MPPLVKKNLFFLDPCCVDPLKTSPKTAESGFTHKLEYQETESCRVSLPTDIDLSALAVTKIPTTNGYKKTELFQYMSCTSKTWSVSFCSAKKKFWC